MKYLPLVFLFVFIHAIPTETSAQGRDSGKDQNQSDHRVTTPSPLPDKEAGKPTPSKFHTEGAGTDDKGSSVKLISLPPITLTDKDKTLWDRIFDWGPWISNFLLVIVGGLQVWLLLRTWKAIEKQSSIQEAGMTQWVDLQPDGLLTEAEGSDDPPRIVTINPRWKIVNKTPLPFTIETVSVHVARDAGWEISEFEVDEVVSPISDSQNYFTFFTPVRLTATETADFLAEFIELSIMVGVVYRGASGKQEKQSFGDFYVCGIGKLEINKPIGKQPHDQRTEKYDGPSTLVMERKRILESERESPPNSN